ncbi:hypothetical protein MKX03_011864, partial [Papaver bracteatum]
METCFLDYQEGKPFSTCLELINDACLQLEKMEYVMNYNKTIPLSTVEMCYEQFKGQGFLFVNNNKLQMKRSFGLNFLVGSFKKMQSTIQIPSLDKTHRSYHHQLELITAKEEFSEQQGYSNLWLLTNIKWSSK